MRLGKLGDKELQKYIIEKLKATRSEVLLSSAPGEDCAALKIDDIVLLSSDPITAEMQPASLGPLAVDVACNDIVSNGGEPVALMVTLIMPVESDPCDIGVIMESLVRRAAEIDVDVIGGHTEFSDSVVRPLLSLTSIGKTKKLIKKSGLEEGDKIYLTKYAGMEGTVIIAEKFLGLLSESERADLEFFKKSLSVIEEGKILKKYSGITTMHDITEGGVLGSVAEICFASKKGAVLYEKDIPLSPLTKRLCEESGIDPYRFISSGSLMFTGKNLEPVLKELRDAGIKYTEIGEVSGGGNVVFVKNSGEKLVIETAPDELFRYLYSQKRK